ncbi:MAG: hypothetical protein ACOX6O_08525 [Christensenellales bacterium]|jgi:hypothetical protein
MGLFVRFKKNEDDKAFSEWLDIILKADLSNEIVAINFNLYEDTDNKWSIELIGTSMFDENDEDWACCEVFSTRNHPFVIVRESNWKEIETLFTDWVINYLATGKYSDKLKQYQAVGIGFVDGDLQILYKR